MRKTGRYVLLTALAVLVVAGITLWQWGFGRPVRWGRGQLTVSERAWHEARLKRLGNLLQELALREPRDDEGRIIQPYDTYLVVDLRRRALWIEDRGQIIENSRCELPGQLTWEAQLADPNGTRKLGDLVRLQWRGIVPQQWRLESLALVGYSRTGAYSAFYFHRGSCAMSLAGTSPYKGGWRGQPVAGVHYYDSMLVDDAEYKQVRRTNMHAGQAPAARQHVTEVHTNIAPWLAMEKTLYQRLEEEVLRAGFDPRRLSVVPDLDYSAGYAEIKAANDGFLPRLFHRVSHAVAVPRIEHLGDGVWYVRSVPDPAAYSPSPSGRAKQLPFEFVISAGKSLSASEQREWLRKGREYQKNIKRLPARRRVKQKEWTINQKDTPGVPPRWRIELASGVTFELVGIRESTGVGKAWWGPDGTPLRRAPCVLPPPSEPNSPTSESYDIVWRTRLPAIFRKKAMEVEEVKLEGGAPSPYQLLPDYRYGSNEPGSPHSYLAAVTCQFEPGREKTTLTLGKDLGGRRPVHIRFENISLVPNRDFGFRIERVQ